MGSFENGTLSTSLTAHKRGVWQDFVRDPSPLCPVRLSSRGVYGRCDTTRPAMVRAMPPTMGAVSGSPSTAMEAAAVMAGTR